MKAFVNRWQSFALFTVVFMFPTVCAQVPGTITSLSISANTVPANTSIALIAKVSTNGNSVMNGRVDFCNARAVHCSDSQVAGTAQLTAAGTATLRFVPSPGTHVYKAVFVGTNSVAGSTSNESTVVVIARTGPQQTIVGVQASGAQGDYSLLGTVATNGSASPTGSVSFWDMNNANYVLGTALLQPTGSNGISFFNSFNFSSMQHAACNCVGEQVSVADLNNDGIPDLIVADNNQALNLLFGVGDGTFTVAELPPDPSGSGSDGAVSGDFNSDGRTDLAVQLQDGVHTRIWLGNGDGTFTVGPLISQIEGTLVVGDFNGDGIEDLLYEYGDSSSAPSGSTNFYFQVWTGNGDGTFTRVQTRSPIEFPDSRFVLGDFDGDGKLDIIAINFPGTPPIPTVSLLIGNGDGTFHRGASIASGTYYISLATADLNGDGKADLIVANQDGKPATVFLGNGNGTFTALPPDSNLNQISDSIGIGDFNGDGIPDLVFPNEDGGYTSVFIGKGDGTFTPDAYSPSVADFLFESIAIADFNGDGQADIVEGIIDGRPQVQNGIVADDHVAVLLSQAPNTAAGYVYNISPVGTGIHYVVGNYLGDINDIGGTSGPVPLLAEQVPTTLTLSANPASSSSGQQVTLTGTLNQFLAQNHYASGAVTFTSNGKSLGAPSVVNGVATLTVSTLAVGKDNLLAKYLGDTNFTASSSSIIPYIVSAQSPQTINFPQPPSPAYTGTSTTLTATASSNLPVTYTVLSGPGSLSGSTLTYTTSGTVVVAANQAGNAQFSAAPQVTRSIVVLGRLAAIALTATPSPVFLQNPVLLTASVSSTAATPTGSVIFLDGSTPLGSANLTGGVATISTSTLTLGFHTITAAYSGDTVFAAVVSPATTVVVQDFSLTITNPNVIIPHGGTAVYSLIVGTIGGPGMASTISFSISGNPDHSPVTFNPSTVPTGAGTTNVSLTIATPNYPVGPFSQNLGPRPTLAMLALAALSLPLLRNKKLRQSRLGIPVLLLVTFTLLTATSGCGSGWGTQGYSLKVTATSGALSRSAAATLTSKPQ